MTPNKCYLGDSVYCEIEPYGCKLTTENGDGPSNNIFMEAPVCQAFFEFLAKHSEERIAANKAAMEKEEKTPGTVGK